MQNTKENRRRIRTKERQRESKEKSGCKVETGVFFFFLLFFFLSSVWSYLVFFSFSSFFFPWRTYRCKRQPQCSLASSSFSFRRQRILSLFWHSTFSFICHHHLFLLLFCVNYNFDSLYIVRLELGGFIYILSNDQWNDYNSNFEIDQIQMVGYI